MATSASVVTISNDHPHHAGLSATTDTRGSFHAERVEYEIGGALIWGVRTLRRKSESDTPSPKNTAFIIQLEELTVCHLGDLAEAPLSPEELTHIKDADVLLVPGRRSCTMQRRRRPRSSPRWSRSSSCPCTMRRTKRAAIWLWTTSNASAASWAQPTPRRVTA